MLDQLPLPPSGDPPPVATATHTDVFVVRPPPTPAADVLWVIDGSCSMTQEIAFLADHFPTFMRTIDESATDYHVAVIGTDLSILGQLMRWGPYEWIDRDTPNPTGAYVAMANQAGSGGASGYNFDAAHACLDPETGPCVTSGFRRDDAPIHTIVVTDERDTSSIGPGGFVSFYRELADEPEDRTFSGILDTSNTQAYIQASNQIGGVVADVLEAEWAEMLRQFAQMTADSVERERLSLSKLPVVESIRIEKYRGDVLLLPPSDDTWVYDFQQNSILIDTQEERDFEFHITYEMRSAILDPGRGPDPEP